MQSSTPPATTPYAVNPARRGLAGAAGASASLIDVRLVRAELVRLGGQRPGIEVRRVPGARDDGFERDRERLIGSSPTQRSTTGSS